jgi:hypothetical protein
MPLPGTRVFSADETRLPDGYVYMKSPSLILYGERLDREDKG